MGILCSVDSAEDRLATGGVPMARSMSASGSQPSSSSNPWLPIKEDQDDTLQLAEVWEASVGMAMAADISLACGAVDPVACDPTLLSADRYEQRARSRTPTPTPTTTKHCNRQ